MLVVYLNLMLSSYNPANIRLDEDVSWRHLEDVFRLRLQKTSSRRLDQDEYIRLTHVSPEDVFKTFSRRLQDVLRKLLQDIFKTSSRCFEDVFKKSSRRLAKTSSKHLEDVLQRCFQVVFKTYHQVKLFAYVKDLPRSSFWEIYGQYRKFASVMKNFSSFSITPWF